MKLHKDMLPIERKLHRLMHRYKISTKQFAYAAGVTLSTLYHWRYKTAVSVRDYDRALRLLGYQLTITRFDPTLVDNWRRDEARRQDID
ncbi:hypothetical protein UFOVP568_20 [uncultured Caudovirales phage]|uniref:HTH_XRE domain containing protein n=1 Tax=uncultured Caudovirales phage TaxID=2100421 RepID=A0A6J5MZD1_9CAUD|nr:hypothetical protein UFOVP568_20 [uncultured Caudovirales phage]